MAERSRSEHTCIARDWGRCIDDYIEDVPFPICGSHALTFWRKLREAIDRRRLIHGLQKPHPLAGVQPPEPEPVVYYVLIDGLIKIGTTVDLKQRLGQYPPTAHLLATEPGDYSIETKRHRQFHRTLAAKREWFTPCAELWDHIRTLRDAHESA